MLGLLDDPREYRKQSSSVWMGITFLVIVLIGAMMFFTAKVDPHADSLPLIARLFGLQSSWEAYTNYRARVQSDFTRKRAELQKEQIQLGMDRNDWSTYLENSKQQIANLDTVVQNLAADIELHSKESASLAKGEGFKSDEHSQEMHQISGSLLALRVQDNLRKLVQTLEADISNKRELRQHAESELEQQTITRNQNPLWNKMISLVNSNRVLVDGEGNIQLVAQEEDRPWREILGSSTWHLLHNVAAKYSDEPTHSQKEQLLNLLRSLQYIFPCSSCKTHIAATMQDPSLTPLDAFVASREAISVWMCSFHNLVNRRLNKPLFPCTMEDLDAKYLANCDECKTEDESQSNEVLQRKQPPEGSLQIGGSLCGINIFKWIQGENTFNFSSNDLTLFVFWMPHCSVCKQEIPELEKLYQANKDKGFNIITFTDATSENESAVRTFLAEKGITYPVAVVDFQEEGMAYGQLVGKYKGIPMGSLRRRCQEEWKGMGFGLKNVPGIVQRLLREG